MNANNQSDNDSRFSDTTEDNCKRAKKEQDFPEAIVVLTYASKKAAQCMTTAATFVLQLHAMTPTPMRLFVYCNNKKARGKRNVSEIISKTNEISTC